MRWAERILRRGHSCTIYSSVLSTFAWDDVASHDICVMITASAVIIAWHNVQAKLQRIKSVQDCTIYYSYEAPIAISNIKCWEWSLIRNFIFCMTIGFICVSYKTDISKQITIQCFSSNRKCKIKKYKKINTITNNNYIKHITMDLNQANLTSPLCQMLPLFSPNLCRFMPHAGRHFSSMTR